MSLRRSEGTLAEVQAGLPARVDAELAALGLIAGVEPADRFLPPPDVAAAAASGLSLRARHGRGGTTVGVARAEALAARRPLTAAEMRQAAGWFARFAYLARKPGWGEAGNPSAGWIAWQLWGGDPGRAWVEAERPRWS